MSRRRKTGWNPYSKDDGGGDDEADAWMMSYGDMMTLLLVFFVLLFAISEIDPTKMQQVTQSIRNAMGDTEEYVPTLAEIQEEVTQSVNDLNIDDKVQVERNKNGVQLMLQGESFFQSGSAQLRSSVKPFLDEISWQILKTPYVVSVEGHTDNIPIRSRIYPSNWELSAARAASVVRYFEQRSIPSHRFRVMGFADSQPMDPILGNSTPNARAKNRRVIITFLSEFAPKEVLGAEWADIDLIF